MTTTRKIVYSAVAAALVAVLTMFPHIPVPGGGYVHLGDAMLLFSVFFLGVWGIPAAAVGSALADVFLGYFTYAPATFIIKGAMALVAFAVLHRGQAGFVKLLLAAILAELVMLLGYFAFESVLYGFAAAFSPLLYNLIQAGAAVILSPVICYSLGKVAFFRHS